MAGQLDIIEWIAAQPQNFRASDASTSRAAGYHANQFRGADQEQIYQVLRLSTKPLAAEEISDILGWDDHVRCNRRLAEIATPLFDEYGALIRPALIERTPFQHTNRSGRKAFKYQKRQPAQGGAA